MKIIQVTSNADGDIVYGLGDDGEIYEYAAERLPFAGWRYYWTKHGVTEQLPAIDNLVNAILRHTTDWPLPFAQGQNSGTALVAKAVLKDTCGNEAKAIYYTEDCKLVLECAGLMRELYWRDGKWTQ